MSRRLFLWISQIAKGIGNKKIFLSLFVLLVFGLGEGRGEELSNDWLYEPVPLRITTLPSAKTLVAGVRAVFPDGRLRIRAAIKAKKGSRSEEREIYAEMLMSNRDGLYSALYTLRDTLGGDLEQLAVMRESGEIPRYTYRCGNPLEESPIPNLFQQVQSTDLAWIDLSMAYLWWPGGETVGTDRIRGRSCYIILLPSPDRAKGIINHTRIWIDPKVNMLLKTEAYNRKNELTRKMTVESFKKIDGVWFIKDVNIYSYPSRQKTTLRIREIKTLPEIVEAGKIVEP